MAGNDVMAVDDRLGRLEETVANGFFAQGRKLDQLSGLLQQHGGLFQQHGSRMDRLEDRLAAVESKLDIVAESIRGDIATVLEAVTGLTSEMRRTTESIRKEHEADRRLTKSILFDHVSRIRNLEGAASNEA